MRARLGRCPRSSDRTELPGAGTSAVEREAEELGERLAERADERAPASESAFEFGGAAPER
ncbi:hypothetical protein [Haloarchaeobius salinus]|uniref:hypothetical protein n=1 Tax=Haloarchaeobius salinus TaxID=1198298 RepID=UPI00210EEDF1|nr:hypothetical protein [Haloarchaeobius salinus]